MTSMKIKALGAQNTGKLPVLGPVRFQPGPHLKPLATHLQALQRRSYDAASQAQTSGHSLVEYLVAQVGVLQEALVTVTDTFVSELDALRQESKRWQAERQEWMSKVVAIRQEVNDKLMEVERTQAATALELATAKADVQAAVLRQTRQLNSQAATLAEQVAVTRVEVQVLSNSVREMKTLTARDFPSEVLRQRMLDKAEMDKAVTQAVAEIVPTQVREAVQRESPAAVQQQVGELLRELVERNAQPLRHEVTRAVEQMSQDVGAMTVEVAQLAGLVGALSDRAKALEAACATTDTRVQGLETLELPLLGGLNDRLDAVCGQQARFAQSLEEVVKAIVRDANDLSCTAQRHEDQLAVQAQHLEDVREALVRCSTVFSALLGVPAPVPARVMEGAQAARRGAHEDGGGRRGEGGGSLSPEMSVESLGAVHL